MPFPDMDVGDWCLIPKVGAYINPGASFNGFEGGGHVPCRRSLNQGIICCTWHLVPNRRANWATYFQHIRLGWYLLSGGGGHVAQEG